MALQLDATTRQTQIAALVTAVGSAGTCKIFSGAQPANCAAADPSGLLATITLPSPALTSAGGVTTLSGTWSVAASGTGTAASFRIYDSGAVCRVQGSTSTDLVLNNSSIATGQTVSVTQFSLTRGNA